jgi:hypothetical protein
MTQEEQIKISEKIAIAIKENKPYCPRCQSVMEATRFVGYYDSFDFWACKCDNLPVEETVHGCYA